MNVFAFVGTGYKNLDEVRTVRIGDGGEFVLLDANERVIDSKNKDFPETLVSVVPVEGQWEMLTLGEIEGGVQSVYAEPILAWGFTVLGNLVPIVPNAMNGVFDASIALRRKGTQEIYMGSVDPYPNEKVWLEHMRSQNFLI